MECHKVVARRSLSEDKKKICGNDSLNNSSSSGTSRKISEIKDVKHIAHFFLQGELMRQFLLDEDIWLFIQNVKLKLKENPVEFDHWLDNQLQLVKGSPGSFFNADIPPFHHIKKGIETTFACTSTLSPGIGSSSVSNHYCLAEHAAYQDEHVKERKEGKEGKDGKEGKEGDISLRYSRSLETNEDGTWGSPDKGRLGRHVEIENKKSEIYKKDSTIRADKTAMLEKVKQHKNYDIIDLKNEKKLDNIEEVRRELGNFEKVHNYDMNNTNITTATATTGTTTNRTTTTTTVSSNNTNRNSNSNNKRENNHMSKDGKGGYAVSNSMDFTAATEKDYDIMKRRKKEIVKGEGGLYYTGDNEKNEIYAKEAKKGKDVFLDNSTLNNITGTTEGRRKKNTANIMIRRYFNDDNSYDANTIHANNTEATQQEYEEKESRLHMDQFSEIEKFIAEKTKERDREKIELKREMEGMNTKSFIDDTKNGGVRENKGVSVYIPRITPKIDEETNNDTKLKLKELFAEHNRMDIDIFEKVIVVDFLKIGRYMSHTLFSRIAGEAGDFVTYDSVCTYFQNRFIDGSKDPSYYCDKKYKNMFKCPPKDFDDTNMLTGNSNNIENHSGDIDERMEMNSVANQRIDHIAVPFKKCSVFNFFNAMKSDLHRDFLEFKDFDPYIREIIHRNRSLNFLLKHVEYLERYIESVIIRIYYQVDINDTNKIYLRDLQKTDLAHVWCYLDDSVHVQNVRQYFSYSHFYVYYSTFCQISSCKDMLIDDSDLYRFDNHSLNGFIVNRIWSKICMKLTGPNQKYMCLNDWIYFIMNYEDMTSNRAIEFWFKLIDLDGDSVIRYHEIQAFFNIQIDRLKSHYLEEPKFEDWLCQMNDAIQPVQEGNFTLSDFKRNKTFAAHFFGCLVSLSKLLTWESRDVHKELQIEAEFPEWSPWDVYCKTKYDELCFMEYESSYEEIQDCYDGCDNYDVNDANNVYVLETN